MTDNDRKLCSEARLSALLAAAAKDEARATGELTALLLDFPSDPRLHFLKGSFLAGKQDYAAARMAMRRAVDLAPDYGIARFQLGLLLLTSGEPYAAQEAWGPLHGLAAEHYLRLFVEGLCHLIRDEFGRAIQSLEEGIARNAENPAMNRDMQLVIDEINRKRSDSGGASSVDLLLQQAALKATRH